MITQLIVAFFATVSFSVLFHIPRKQCMCCGITGATGWLCYLIATNRGVSVVMASFVATAALTALARVFAVQRRTPITLFLIAGIFPLVPGAGIYYTAYHFIMGENQLAMDKGLETVKIAVAIAMGIVCIFSLSSKLFEGFNFKTRQGG
ncbi:MAG: threonine/serine exporter family protein [Cellulosilyticaceae bacterium]